MFDFLNAVRFLDRYGLRLFARRASAGCVDRRTVSTVPRCLFWTPLSLALTSPVLCIVSGYRCRYGRSRSGIVERVPPAGAFDEGHDPARGKGSRWPGVSRSGGVVRAVCGLTLGPLLYIECHICLTFKSVTRVRGFACRQRLPTHPGATVKASYVPFLQPILVIFTAGAGYASWSNCLPSGVLRSLVSRGHPWTVPKFHVCFGVRSACSGSNHYGWLWDHTRNTVTSVTTLGFIEIWEACLRPGLPFLHLMFCQAFQMGRKFFPFRL